MESLSRVSEVDPLEDLLFAAGRGDRQAFARVYKLSASTLFAISLRILRHRELAEEVVQEAYISIWKKAGQFDPARGRPLSWMITIVRHRAIDRLRSRKLEPRAVADIEDINELELSGDLAAPAPPDRIADGLRDCLGRLQSRQQEAILLAYYYGLTHEELAARLDAALGTVKSWVRRGLLQLKECLDQ